MRQNIKYLLGLKLISIFILSLGREEIIDKNRFFEFGSSINFTVFHFISFHFANIQTTNTQKISTTTKKLIIIIIIKTVRFHCYFQVFIIILSNVYCVFRIENNKYYNKKQAKIYRTII